MTIQWFPGHMAKARREVTEKLKLVDIVFELIDARLPLSSRNPMIDEVIHQKPRLVILNKADLADRTETDKWVSYFKEQGIEALAVNSFEGQGLQVVTRKAKEILTPQRERLERRGIRPGAIRAMIVGIPNVGKSTLINRLAKRNIAKTGNKPGVTRAQQWIKYGKELELLDTPGILWPKFEDQEAGYKLALTGAIKDTVLNMDDLALYGLRFLEAHYPDRLEEKYGLTTIGESPDEILAVFDHLGKLKNTMIAGGEIDYDKVSELVVQDIRTEQLGKLTFDLVEDEQQ